MINIDLSKIQFFCNFSAESLELVRKELKAYSFRKGHIFFEEGEQAKGLYILVSGEVGVYKRINEEEHVLHKVSPGHLFGEFALLTSGLHDDFARAEKHCKVFFLAKETFEKIITRDKNAGLAISISLSRKLHELRQRIVNEKNKTILAVIYNQGDPKDKSWLALEVALSLREQTGKKVLLIDLLSDPQNLENILRKKFNYDYILINLPQYKDSVSNGIIAQCDFLLNLSEQDLSLYPKFYKKSMKVISVDLEQERQLDRLDWYVGHLARVISRSTIGLALGSGTVGGLVHIGVLKYLQEKKIPIDMIAGCSGGALYGALWAYSRDWKFVAETVRNNGAKKFRAILDFSWSLLGLAKGNILKKVLEKVFGRNFNIENLKIPTVIVASNLTKRETVELDKGKLWPALRASISLPIVFTPVKINGDIFVDGNATNPLPVQTLRQRGIDKVIAVYASQRRKGEKLVLNNMLDVFLQARSLTNDHLAFASAKNADIFINPDISRFGMFEYEKIDELIALGYRTAKQSFEAI